MSKKVLFVLLILICSFNVYAANITTAYEWLNKQTPADVFSSSFAILVLKESGSGQEYLNFIEKAKSQEGCYPDKACKAKDTALAVLISNKEGKTTDEESGLTWLKNNQQTSLTGEWLLQIDTSSTGECEIQYTINENQIKKKINVDKGYIKSDKCSSPSTYFNLGSCLESNLLSKPPVQLEIGCGFDSKISSLYRDQDILYLNDDVVSGTTATIKINNGNFDDYESTLFISWVLKEINYNEFNSEIYLRKNYQQNNVKSNAFLYLLTQKQDYVNELINLQNSNDGSFGSVQDTAVAIHALNDGNHESQIQLARQWLTKQQKIDGSWNSNLLDTVIASNFGYPKSSIDLGITTDETETTSCNDDSFCDDNEDSESCPSDCKTNDKTDEEEIEPGTSEETDEEEIEPGTSEETDEEESSGLGKIIFISIILILLCVLGFFGYKKFGKDLLNKSNSKKPFEKPSFNFEQIRPEIEKEKKSEFKGPINILKSISKVDSTRKSKIEEDLERSLKEAKKILEK